MDFGEIHRTRPHGLRDDVVVEARLRAQPLITLRLYLRKAGSNAVQKRGEADCGRFEAEALGHGLFHVPVYAQVRAHRESRAENMAVADIGAVSVVGGNNARPAGIGSAVIGREIYFLLVFLGSAPPQTVVGREVVVNTN